MARSSKESWLKGPGDLKEADVEDVPVEGESVRVRGLAAAYSNQAQSEALEVVTGNRGEQSARVNTEKLEVIQFARGVIEPTFTMKEAQKIAETYGPAFRKVVSKIDELSGVNKEEVEAAEARFQPGAGDEGREDLGDAAPDGSS